MDITVEHREGAEETNANQVLKSLDVSVIVNDSVDFVHCPDGGKELNHFLTFSVEGYYFLAETVSVYLLFLAASLVNRNNCLTAGINCITTSRAQKPTNISTRIPLE